MGGHNLLVNVHYRSGDHINMPSILIYFPCISKSITFPLSAFVDRLLDKGHDITFATSYGLQSPRVTNVEVGAGIRHWADETASKHLFAGKDLLETNLFDLSMEAQSEAVEKLLAMNKKWDTVIVYPAFGNEVSSEVIGWCLRQHTVTYHTFSYTSYFTFQHTG